MVARASGPSPDLLQTSRTRRQWCAGLVAGCFSHLHPAAAWARPDRPPAPHGAPGTLPPAVRQALRQAGVPESAMTAVVQEVGQEDAALAHQAQTPVNPASLMKLVTTYAALDRLGPTWNWSTPVHFTGPVRDGVLDGDLVIQGRGDPMLVVERLWQGLMRIRELGVQDIRGDIVLDRSAFARPEVTPGDFDGDPSRPYNVLPDALLLNFHASQWTFAPEPSRGVARVTRDLDEHGALVAAASAPGMSLQATPPRPAVERRTVADSAPRPGLTGPAAAAREVPLADGPCGDWRTLLQAEPTADGWRFQGRYPASCGTLSWPLAATDPERFGADLVRSLWERQGGRLRGRVRSVTQTPAVLPGQTPALIWPSPPLSEAVRDINKFSNNVMAQQLFLTLARSARADAPATEDAARVSLCDWAVQRLGEPAAGELVIDNGSGLSRHNRLTAQWLARLLQHAWASPLREELLNSLPISGVDGTLRRSRITPGRAQLKTGSLRDVIGLAGYVLDTRERRFVLVGLVQHAQAQAARPALEALVEWVVQGASPRHRAPRG